MSETYPQKGVLLKEAREARGISLQAVHEETKIPLDVLKAIEEGYTVRSLSPFYLKGFMKMYAQYLEVEVKDVVDDYEPEQLPETKPFRYPEEIFKDRLQKFFSRKRKQQIVKGAGLLVLILILIKLISFFASENSSDSKKTKPQTTKIVEEQKKRREAAPVEKTSKPPAAAEKEQKSKAAPPSPPSDQRTKKKTSVSDVKSTVILSVRARSNSWLRVTADGNIIFQAVLKGGVTETWSANEKIEISGRISQLEFELNGKMIGALGREDRSAKKIIVTPNGLSVEK